MSNLTGQRLNVLIFGVEGGLAQELSAALEPHAVFTLSKANPELFSGLLATTRFDVVFCPALCLDTARAALEAASRIMPIVVVSRLPEVREWLDAIEAGAADYCAAPFEPTQLNWILDTHLVRVHRAVA